MKGNSAFVGFQEETGEDCTDQKPVGGVVVVSYWCWGSAVSVAEAGWEEISLLASYIRCNEWQCLNAHLSWFPASILMSFPSSIFMDTAADL